MIDGKNRNLEGFVRHPNVLELVKISGVINNLITTRDEASFVFTENDKNTMGVIAVSAALVGLDGQATAISSNASAMEEAADYVEFNIDERIVKGWLWRNPFSEGDTVNVAVEWQGDHYELFAVSRPSDKTIALYPHCSRARCQHIRNAVKWWFLSAAGMQILLLLLNYFLYGDENDSFNDWIKFFHKEFGWRWVFAIFIMFAIPVASMTRQWMPFVKVAEKVFRALELPNPGRLDLIKSSKKQRTSEDKAEFGIMYFRY